MQRQVDPSPADALRQLVHSSQDLLVDQFALLRHDVEVQLSQAVRRTACNAAALFCAGVATVFGTLALYLYFSTWVAPHLAALGLCLLHLGAAWGLRWIPQAPAAWRRTEAQWQASTDVLRGAPQADAAAEQGQPPC